MGNLKILGKTPFTLGGLCHWACRSKSGVFKAPIFLKTSPTSLFGWDIIWINHEGQHQPILSHVFFSPKTCFFLNEWPPYSLTFTSPSRKVPHHLNSTIPKTGGLLRHQPPLLRGPRTAHPRDPGGPGGAPRHRRPGAPGVGAKGRRPWAPPGLDESEAARPMGKKSSGFCGKIEVLDGRCYFFWVKDYACPSLHITLYRQLYTTYCPVRWVELLQCLFFHGRWDWNMTTLLNGAIRWQAVCNTPVWHWEIFWPSMTEAVGFATWDTRNEDNEMGFHDPQFKRVDLKIIRLSTSFSVGYLHPIMEDSRELGRSYQNWRTSQTGYPKSKSPRHPWLHFCFDPIMTWWCILWGPTRMCKL